VFHPQKLLVEYFPRLEEIADKVLFGTDWPGFGVRDVGGKHCEVQDTAPLRSGPAQDSLRQRCSSIPAVQVIHAGR